MQHQAHIPNAYGKGQELGHFPSPLKSDVPHPTMVQPWLGGGDAPALTHTPQEGCAAAFPHPAVSGTTAPGQM